MTSVLISDLEYFNINDSKKSIEILKRNNIPKLKESDIKFDFSVGHRDGPATGICSANGKKCWFERVNEGYVKYNDGEFILRLYVIVPISDKEYQKELEIHNIFKKNVGKHTTYKSDGKTRYKVDGILVSLIKTLLGRKRSKYYNNPEVRKFQQEVNYDHRAIIGWWIEEVPYYRWLK